MSLISCDSIDDLMKDAITSLTDQGMSISPSKGPALEIRGVLFELKDPRARLSRTESRGKVFSALGELCWYLRGSDIVDHMRYYLPKYEASLKGNQVPSAYGPRAFRSWKGISQIQNVCRHLNKSDSRRAVIQLFDASDLGEGLTEAPCTCTLQFFKREGVLHLHTTMRSNDIIKGFPHDIFCFTMIQEILSVHLGLTLGEYKHFVGSLHLYDKHSDIAKQFQDEGFQEHQPMPHMPSVDLCKNIRQLLINEKSIRTSQWCLSDIDSIVAPYWKDLTILLSSYSCSKQDDTDLLKTLFGKVTNDVFRPYIQSILDTKS